MLGLSYRNLGLRNSSDSDFVARGRVPVLQAVVLALLAVILMVAGVRFFAENLVGLALFIFIVSAAVLTYIFITMQLWQDKVVAIEFQSSIFASALATGEKFCMILRYDGTITHMSPYMLELFPNAMRSGNCALDDFLSQASVPKEHWQYIYSAVSGSSNSSFILEVTDCQQKTHKLVITAKDMVRPKGFTVLRGHEFVEKRAGEGGLASLSSTKSLNEDNFLLLAQATDSIGVGVYIASMDKKFLFANNTLKNRLQIGEGEISSRNLQVRDFVRDASGRLLSNFEDFVGEVSLVSKNGGSVRAFLNHKIFKSDGKEPIACVGFLEFASEQDAMRDIESW